MPKENNFLHSKYSRSNPGDRVTYLTFEPGAPPQSPAWNDAMGHMGQTLVQAGVRLVLFIYGSHLGSDLLGSGRLDEVGGLKRGYSRGIPGVESLLSILRPATYLPNLPESAPVPPFSNEESLKDHLDSLVHHTGNFSGDYLSMFQDGLNQHLSPPIPCLRYLWTSTHHHLGRIQESLALFQFLDHLHHTNNWTSKDRVLLIGHGHAGHILSLLSNLITPSESSIRPMVIEILQSYFSQDPSLTLHLEHLTKLESFLSQDGLQNWPNLDMVTLGTPVRHGWDVDGVAKLLHIVNHRPIRSDHKTWLAKMDLPQVAWEIPTAIGGDYVQQMAVAGTDAVPATDIEQEVNQNLREYFEPYDGFERWLECARRATRCQNDGHCLLIDYQDASEAHPSTHLFGHAIYTQPHTILFQTNALIQKLYPSES